MISINVGTIEAFDDHNQEFMYYEGGVVDFEYSLKAVYEWEGVWKKSFLKQEATPYEMFDFYKRMAINGIEDKFLTDNVIRQLKDYIGDKSTATTFTSREGQNGNKSRPTKYTSEEVYASMFSAGIPLEFENRNLNRLMTILQVISVKNGPAKKMDKQEVMKQNRDLNKARKEQLKTKG